MVAGTARRRRGQGRTRLPQPNIQLGLFLEGPDDRPRVRTIRPGGTAKGKVEVGDVVLATSYTVLTNVRDSSWGSARKVGSTPETTSP